MGTYDILTDGEREGQVKCWDNHLILYDIGDDVPTLDGKTSYSIVLREGGYAWIHNNIFLGIEDKPFRDFPIADKYGDWQTTESAMEFYNSASDPFSIVNFEVQKSDCE